MKPVSEPADPHAADHTPVGAIMTANVFCVRRETDLARVRELFASESISGAPVVDAAGRPIGVISRTDLLRLDYLPDDATVDDLMTPMAFTLRENASVAQAAALMAFEGIHRLPVLGADGTVVGIVSTLDVARWLAHHDGYLVRRT